MSNSNKFAIVLAKILEVIEKGDGIDQTTNSSTTETWDTVSLVLRKSAEGPVAYVKGLNLYEILDSDDVKLLESNDLFVEGGEVLRVKLNNKTTTVMGIRFNQLKELARETEKSSSELIKCRERVKELERELRTSREANAADEVAAEFYRGMQEYASKLNRAPAVRSSKPVRKPVTKALGGVPVLFCSDWHWDEVVQPGEILHANSYNRAIASARADRVVDKALDITLNHMSGQHYEGFIFCLGGDMVSGNIHDELRETNEAPMMETVVDLAAKLAAKIRLVASEFPDVLVPCVSGNHGRMSKAWSSKNKQKDNYDYCVYKMVQAFLADLPNVRVLIEESTDVLFQSYHVKYLLTHGDQFKSTGGADGMMAAIKRGDAQKRKLLQAAGGYDYMLLGHFHNYRIGDGVIVNGSLKGMDEFAFQQNFEYEPARQALWITHPYYGIGNHMAIYGDEPESDGVDYPAISIPDTKVVRMFK